MKKLLAMMLALVMVMSLTVTAFATENAEVETGSITINGVGGSTIYKIYKLMDLESYDISSGAYSYKPDAAWAEYFASPEAKVYFTVDKDGYVTWTWKPAEGSKEKEEEAVAAFAKKALAYAKAHTDTIQPVKTSDTAGAFVPGTSEDGKPSGKFSELPLGYYLVDSTMGALCGLTTTNPDASINAKNGIPTIDKQVQEDSTSQWGAANTADIGQIVEYRVTINVHAGAENYVLHDTMENGLTFKHDTAKTPLYPDADKDSTEAQIFRGVWKIEHVIPEVSTTIVDEDYYTVASTGDHGFTITFTQAFCDHLQTNDKVIVHYNAMLNREAEIAEAVNTNKAWLTFGEGGKSNEDTVDTKTFFVDIVKTDSQNLLIDGAKFKIYDTETGDNEVKVVILEATCAANATEKDYLTDSTGSYLLFDLDENGIAEEKITHITSYRRARADESGVDIVVCGGRVAVKGLDNGTYYLQETEAPEGYNKLTSRQRFIISDENLDATFNGDVFSTGSGVHVINKTGTILPETGGFGTVLFICFGMFVAVATGVLLVTKKRVSMIQD